MLADLVIGDLRLPAQHKPLDDLYRVLFHVRAQERLGLELTLRITDQYPPDGQGWQTAMKPHRRLRNDLDHALAFPIPIADRDALPARPWISRNLFDRRQTVPLLAWATFRASGALGRGLVQGGVQSQTHDQAQLARQPRQPKQPQNR